MLSFVLDDPGSEAAPAAPTTTTPEPIAPPDDGSVPVAAVPTEATAAPLPIGASVGPAALPIMPYDVRYNGNFFHMADLFAELDSKVELDVSNDASFKPDVQGRLVTVDGFAMVPDLKQGYPNVLTTIALTTYIVPEDQGLQAGGTPAGPAPVGSPEAPTITSTEGTFPGGATATVAP